MALLLAASAVAGCSSAEGPPDRPPVAENDQEFSSFGIERVIPLRVVMMANDCTNPRVPSGNCAKPEHVIPDQHACSACTDNPYGNCGPDTTTLAELKNSVEKANWALRALGVQVWVERMEKYFMPTLWDSDPNAQPLWSQVWSEFHGPYPQVNSNWPFAGNQQLLEKSWPHAVTIRAGEPREIIIYVAECSYGGDGQRPWGGAASFIADREIIRSQRAFTHEIAHVLGLEHTMYWTEPWKSTNPEDIADSPTWTDPANYWDLAFGIQPGGQIQYFDSYSQAFNFEHTNPPKTLYPKMTWDPNPPASVNCVLNVLDANSCTPRCCVNGLINQGTGNCTSGQLETLGTPGMRGLGFSFGGGMSGPNAMAYWTSPLDSCPWSSFSESQAGQVRRILRSDIRISNPYNLAPYASGYTAQRFRLGEWRSRTGFDKLDFDGDGKQDIAVWQPPGTPGAGPTIGHFRAMLSSTNYATALNADFGQTGDVPVPADYDGDGKTDFAVIRRGGLDGSSSTDSGMWWMWCPSASGGACPPPNNCTYPTNCALWGYQTDVPLPGLNFDGINSTGELAVYRPTNGHVYWTKTDGTTGGDLDTGGVIGVRAVHLHGLYDSDNKTDLVTYDPYMHQFWMLLSTRSWIPGQAVLRTFDYSLAPHAVEATDAGSDAPAVRHGAVPLPAEANGRRVLRLWDAYTGTWNTMWDPINSSTVQTCAWGQPRDVPLAPIDVNADGYTDYAIFRPSAATVYLKTRGRLCLPGTDEYSFAVAGATARSVIGSIPDMKGSDDGLNDVMLLDPDQSTWTRYYSHVNAAYTAQPAFVLGAVGGVGL